MKLLRLALAFAALALLTVPGYAVFQSGTKLLTGFPATGRITIDNGGPLFTVLPSSAGTLTLNGATPVTVGATGIDSGSVVIFTLKSVNAGTVGAYPAIQTITPGTGFTVAGTAGDLGIYNWVILG